MTSPHMTSPQRQGRTPSGDGQGEAAAQPALPGSQTPHRSSAAEPLVPVAAPAPSRATFLRSFVYAWEGLTYAFRTQRNARIHLVLAIVAFAVGVALHVSPVGMAIVFVAITFVFITEMLNTVAEAIVDMVTQEYHPLAKTAKDVAAGAVLLSAMLAVVIGLLVFGPQLWALGLHVWRR